MNLTEMATAALQAGMGTDFNESALGAPHLLPDGHEDNVRNIVVGSLMGVLGAACCVYWGIRGTRAAMQRWRASHGSGPLGPEPPSIPPVAPQILNHGFPDGGLPFSDPHPGAYPHAYVSFHAIVNCPAPDPLPLPPCAAAGPAAKAPLDDTAARPARPFVYPAHMAP